MDALSEASSDPYLELKVRTNNPQVLAAGFDEMQLPGSGVTAVLPPLTVGAAGAGPGCFRPPPTSAVTSVPLPGTAAGVSSFCLLSQSSLGQNRTLLPFILQIMLCCRLRVGRSGVLATVLCSAQPLKAWHPGDDTARLCPIAWGSVVLATGQMFVLMWDELFISE